MNPFEGWRITSPYGMRIHPIYKDRRMHRGIDLVKHHRYPIPAFIDGIVIHAKNGVSGSGYGNYGLTVALKDKHGYTHVYAHLDEIAVKVGKTITAGAIVGLQGNTGQSAGSHLHYEVREKGFGTDVEPAQYLINYFKKEVSVELEQMKKDIVELKKQLTKEPAKPWQHAIMNEAEQAGIIDKGKHLADEQAQKWFVVELIRKLSKRIDELEEKLLK